MTDYAYPEPPFANPQEHGHGSSILDPEFYWHEHEEGESPHSHDVFRIPPRRFIRHARQQIREELREQLSDLQQKIEKVWG